MNLEWDLALRIVLSGILGAVIGYERQARHKAAGLRTHMLVSMGSCLIMILSYKIYYMVEGHTNADPARLAAQVVSGIGFLGAGSIMKDGLNVRGLTTAASLWVVSAVGLTVGAGFYEGAIFVTVMILVVLGILTKIEYRTYDSSTFLLIVEGDENEELLGQICKTLAEHNVAILDVKLESKSPFAASFLIKSSKEFKNQQIIAQILTIQGIRAARRE
jgi:putative Mg2+ transporter-C (MgtC) family protein